MKAWRFYGFNDMRLDDVPRPPCRPGHVLAKVLCVQPSVTEAQLARGIPTLAYDRINKRLETEAPIQLFGHEFCARVVEVGEGVTRFHIGDRVTARAKLPCEECLFCRTERSHYCRKGPILGFDLPGCFAEYALLPENALVKVDDALSDQEAACVQSLSDGIAAVESAEIRIGDSVAVFGQGSMGLDCAQIARYCGAGTLITVDVREEACSLSKQLGADFSINASQEDPIAAIRKLTQGEGADIVFECAGGSPRQGLSESRTLFQALKAVCSGGKIVQVSWFGKSVNLELDLLRSRSLRYVFPFGSTLQNMEHAVRLVASGKVHVQPLITHVLNGIESVPEAFEITGNKASHQAINPAQVVMESVKLGN